MIFVSWTLQYLHISIAVNIYIYMRKPDKLHELNWWSDKIYAKMEILLLSTYPISQESHHNDDEDDGCYDEDDDDQENFKVSTFPICQAGLTIPCVCHNFSNFETPISMWIGLYVKSVKLKFVIENYRLDKYSLPLVNK